MESYTHALRAFEQANKLGDRPVERVLVPYAGTTLPACFIPADRGERERRPAVVFLSGLDTTKELTFFRVGQHLARRGLSCLAVDTPGIGEALRLQELFTRFDYEVPVAAAVDYLEGRPDVEGQRIGVVGSSLGGYYAARAAAFEPRLKACVAWGGQFDYHAVWERRFQAGGALAVPFSQLMYVTGTPTPERALEHIQNFRLAGFAHQLTCPFLLLHGSEDQQIDVADAEAAIALVGSPDKELKLFTGEDGGTQHCQNDNALPALHYLGDWLAQKLESFPV